MKKLFKYLPLALLFLACDNSTVSRTEYDAVLSEMQHLEDLNDSLQLELSDLKMYVDFLTEENTRLINELNDSPVD